MKVNVCVEDGAHKIFNDNGSQHENLLWFCVEKIRMLASLTGFRREEKAKNVCVCVRECYDVCVSLGVLS